MSDSLLSFTIIFAQLGGVLLIVLLSWIFYYIYKSRKEAGDTRKLIDQIKDIIPQHRDQLNNVFKNELELDKTKVDMNVDKLIQDEKNLYNHLINVSVSKDMSLLKLTTGDLNSLINDYVRLLTLKVEIESETDENTGSQNLTIKKENQALRLENISLKKRLDSATETIESMMGEFSSMYEGGKKEGEQRVKNEMYKLQQSLKTEEIKSQSELEEIEEKEN